MLSNYKSSIESQLENIAKSFTWLHPNVLTLLGLVPPLLYFYFMTQNNYWLAVVMLLLTPLDMLDGILARATNRVSAFGGFLDSTLDRIGDFLIIAGLYAAGLASLPVIALLILCTYLISYTRSRAELATKGTIKFNVGLIERSERILFILGIILAHIFTSTHARAGFITEIAITILTVLSFITVAQRVYHAYKKL